MIVTARPVNFTVKAPRGRHHRALFDQSLPFRPRREELKTEYRRRPKHPARDLDNT